ncbi:MAG: bacteriohemerythrin [Gammaproteobacteria bacterium]|nr:bacteriohemerythrin [Gammaproteobacteria bacterium]
MTLIDWKDSFKVGVPEVDHEHRELIEMINDLHEAMHKGAGQDTILESLGEIYAQIAAHFALEEKMMRKAHYPALPEHKQDHETLLDDLREIMDEVEDDGVFNEAQLSVDLERWFSDHFRTHDAKLHKARHHH